MWMSERAPGVFGLPPGVDFPAELVAGLRAQMRGTPPEAMARVTLFVNTQRMRRRVTDILAQDGAGFLPRVRLVTEIGSDMAETGVLAALSPLRRRLDLTVLLDGLLKAEPTLFARTSLYDRQTGLPR
jgi:ATP-dependent helicase/nuclease subunit B